MKSVAPRLRPYQIPAQTAYAGRRNQEFNKMRSTLSLCAVALLLVTGMWLELFSQPGIPQSGQPGTETQVLSTLLPNGIQQVVVVDTRGQTMAVYQIEGKGIIQLKSVRSLRWDLAMEQFNPAAPYPEEMRRIKQ